MAFGNGGKDTKPDVDRLMEIYDTIERGGETIPHEELENHIGLRRDESRFRTVLSAWRKRLLLERGIKLIPVRGIGYKPAAAHEMVGYAIGQVTQIRRKAGRAHTIVGLAPADELDEPNRVRRDHVYRHTGTLLNISVSVAKQVASIRRIPETLPR